MSENDILEYLFPEDFPDTLLRSVTIVGLQGSGKTNLSFFLAKQYLDRYGPENVNVVYSFNSLVWEFLFASEALLEPPVPALSSPSQ